MKVTVTWQTRNLCTNRDKISDNCPTGWWRCIHDIIQKVKSQLHCVIVAFCTNTFLPLFSTTAEEQKGRLGPVDHVCFGILCFVAASSVFESLRPVRSSLVLKYWASGDWCCTMWPSSWSITACVTSKWKDMDGDCPLIIWPLPGRLTGCLCWVMFYKQADKLTLLLKLLEVFFFCWAPNIIVYLFIIPYHGHQNKWNPVSLMKLI